VLQCAAVCYGVLRCVAALSFELHVGTVVLPVRVLQRVAVCVAVCM